jgi:tRNA pseudouridine38-40 synthase
MREEVDFFFLLEELNRNLGGEIRLNSVQSINRNFNLIQSVSKKTYRYFFSDSEVFHPFAASFLTPVSKINPLEKMRLNAGLMIGKHDFRAFCKISGNKTNFIRQISESRVLENQDFNSGFFPENGYCFEVTGSGFLHHQVRKMMSAIWYFSPDEIRQRLESPCLEWIPVPTAPANGLILWDTDLDLIGSME